MRKKDFELLGAFCPIRGFFNRLPLCLTTCKKNGLQISCGSKGILVDILQGARECNSNILPMGVKCGCGDSNRSLSHYDLVHVFFGRDCPISNVSDAVFHLYQGIASIKGTSPYPTNTIGNMDLVQLFAIHKRQLLDDLKPLGENHALQILAVDKRTWADNGNARWNFHLNQCQALIERTSFNPHHVLRKDDILKSETIAECIFFDALYQWRQYDLCQGPTPTECSFSN